MSKKKSRNRKKKNARNRSSGKGRVEPMALEEGRRSASVTVAWVVSMLTTLGALVVAAFARWLAWSAGIEAGEALRLLPNFLLIVAMLTGVATLAFTLAAWKFRDQPAPRSITVAAIIIGLMPWAVYLAM